MQSKLIIKNLTKKHGGAEEITCMSGHVNVFRSRMDERIENFESALFASDSIDQFSLELDGNKIDPTEGIACVGVGTFKARVGATARQILLNAGYKSAKVNSLSEEFGLSDFIEKDWNVLGRDELRKLELLVAVKQKSKIIFVKDPFAPLSEENRERFAQLITKAAVEDNKIVVISRLSERPTSWVGNVSIARIDLDVSKHATIGFDPRLIEQVRSGVLEQTKIKSNILPFIVKKPTKTQVVKHSVVAASMVFVLGTLGSAIGGVSWSRIGDTPSEEKTIAMAEVPVSPPAPAEVTPLPVPAVPVEALSLYDPEISQSIRSAFLEEDEVVPPMDTQDIQVTPQQKKDNTQDIFKSIQENNVALTGSVTTISEEEAIPLNTTSPDVDSWEKTREEMRRRFLESISSND